MIYSVRIWFRLVDGPDEKDCETFPIEANSPEEAESIAKKKRKFVINTEVL